VEFLPNPDYKITFRGSSYYPETLIVKREVNRPATFEFTLPNEEGEYTDIFAPGNTGIMVNLEGKNVLYGLIRNVRHSIDENGEIVRVIGEDYLGPCADELIFRYFFKSDVADIVVNVLPSDFDTTDVVSTHTSGSLLAFEDESRLRVVRDLAEIARSETQFGYDFYLSPSKTFHFFPRKSRDSYKRFVYGSDFATFNYEKDISQLANIVRVYGQGRLYKPPDKELGTEGQSTGWDGLGFGGGTPTEKTGAEYVATGTYSIKFEIAATESGGYWNVLYPSGKNLNYNLRGFEYFRVKMLDATGALTVKLKTAPSDYFYWEWKNPSDGWREVFAPLKDFKVYGKPDWNEINYVQFDFSRVDVGHELYLDGMYFYGRTFYEVSDQASILTYGSKMKVIQDWSISTSDEARFVAEAILDQLKEPIERIQFETEGDPELDPGYLVQLKVPQLNVTGHYRTVGITHMVDEGGFRNQVRCAYEPPDFNNMIGNLANVLSMSAPKRKGINEPGALSEWEPDITREKIAPQAITTRKIDESAVTVEKIDDTRDIYLNKQHVRFTGESESGYTRYTQGSASISVVAGRIQLSTGATAGSIARIYSTAEVLDYRLNT